MNTMNTIMEKILISNRKIKDVFKFLKCNINEVVDNCEFEDYEIDNNNVTSFRINKNTQKISIACPIDISCGDEDVYETILFHSDGSMDHDSIEYHDSKESLLKYIMSF